MRKLATVRKIDNIVPIPGADAIECAKIGGWSVVVKKGEFKPSELVVYLEVDSWVPHDVAPFLSKSEAIPEYQGVPGNRLKTIKLRKQISQGLVLPISVLLGRLGFQELMDASVEGADVTEALGVLKWEYTEFSPNLQGKIKGNFPSFIPKTDQERIQNLSNEFLQWKAEGNKYEVTEKLEGSSMTCYLYNNQFGVCSRNLDLKRDENNSFWEVAIRQEIEYYLHRLREFIGEDVAFQGELIGPGIQKNIYKLPVTSFWLFDIYFIQSGRYATPAERNSLLNLLSPRFLHAPKICPDMPIDEFDTLDEILEYAEDFSRLEANQQREGVVFKSLCGGHTFKAISNRYLLKQD